LIISCVAAGKATEFEILYKLLISLSPMTVVSLFCSFMISAELLGAGCLISRIEHLLLYSTEMLRPLLQANALGCIGVWVLSGTGAYIVKDNIFVLSVT
jgi:hypothetical protein